jgi:nicotinamidase-related amidase
MTFATHKLITPENAVFVFVDQQPQMAFGVRSIDAQILKNNTVALAKTARGFGAPTVLTTLQSEAFSGYVWPELLDVLQQDPHERTTMNFWEDKNVLSAIKATGRKKIVISGLWTGANINFPALCALHEGYEVYVVGDACAEMSPEAQYAAMTRAEKAGAVPMTSLQILLEMQRDWARHETYDVSIDIIREHFGSYGMGIDYAHTHVHKQPQRGQYPQPVDRIHSKAA